MDTIKFANGSVYDCPYYDCANGGSAHIALSGVTIAEAAAVFSDENMTREMECGDKRLIGYTELVVIGIMSYGIEAILKGGTYERIN